MSITETSGELRLDAKREVEARTPSKRMLVIVNPYATTVSDRLKHLVVYALRSSYLVDAVDTERRNHATDLCREAAAAGYDVVVAFGGDGTVNEAANGLAGSDTALTCLPGGRVNVYCRMLGIPADVVDATEHLLGLADDWHPRKVDLGVVNDRYFAVNCGIGLDAAVVQEVDAHPRLKTRFGEYYYAAVGTKTFSRRYLRNPPQLSLTLPDGTPPVQGVLAVIQNGERYTYFGNRAIDLIGGSTLDSGDMSGVVLKHTSPLEIPTIAYRMLASEGGVSRHRQVASFRNVDSLRIDPVGDTRLPIQVDGDYIGEADQAVFSIAPGALTVIS
jgi:diacylglycerol kinase family enzyme